MDGDLGAYVRAQIAKVNLVAMDKIWDNGFRQTTTSTKPINTPEDLRGFKIRVPVRRSGPRCSRRSIRHRRRSTPPRCTRRCRPRWSTARRTRWPSSPLRSSTKCRSTARSRTTCGTVLVLANRRAWDRLPANVRAIVAKHLNAAAENERADVAKLNASLQEELAAKGMVFNRRTSPFRDKLRKAGFYAEEDEVRR